MEQNKQTSEAENNNSNHVEDQENKSNTSNIELNNIDTDIDLEN